MPLRLLLPVFLAALIAAGLAWTLAGADRVMAAEKQQTGRVFIPAPPKGKGDKCVADTDVMRRNHMTMLDHKRDDTVHDGIRTKQFSLKECIACHAVNGPDALPVTSKNPKHFCRVCHDYAAVKIDCFECHASRPEADTAADLPGRDQDRSALASYLKEWGQ